jgi:hypothetical protein
MGQPPTHNECSFNQEDYFTGLLRVSNAGGEGPLELMMELRCNGPADHRAETITALPS